MEELIRNRTILAPMSNVTDPAFRLLCREHEAGVVITEFKNVHGIAEKKDAVKEYVQYSERERPVGAQIFGHDIEPILTAAELIEPHFDFLDFNMGCPAPHVTKQMAGAAMLQEPEHIEKLFSRLVKTVDIPVTLKMRAGVKNEKNDIYKPIARIAEDVGVEMLTLHPRTVEQGYSGEADWQLIKDLNEIVDIPVVGNGDVTSPEKAKRMIEETGCDYVMIGRGARGNPFIFEQIQDYFEKGTYQDISPKQKLKAFKTYMTYAKEFDIDVSTKKNQAMQFTKGIPHSKKLRKKYIKAETEKELLQKFEGHVAGVS